MPLVPVATDPVAVVSVAEPLPVGKPAEGLLPGGLFPEGLLPADEVPVAELPVPDVEALPVPDVEVLPVPDVAVPDVEALPVPDVEALPVPMGEVGLRAVKGLLGALAAVAGGLYGAAAMMKLA